MGWWDRFKKAAGNLWRKAAGAVGSLRKSIGGAWDTVKGWVRPWGTPGSDAVYAAAQRGLQGAADVVSNQFARNRRAFERAQQADNIRDRTARRAALALNMTQYAASAKAATEGIRKGKELAKLVQRGDKLMHRKARERKGRLEADRRAQIETYPEGLLARKARERTALAEYQKTRQGSAETGRELYRGALDVLLGITDEIQVVGLAAEQLIEDAIPENIKELMKNPDVQMMFIPGMGVKTTGGKAGRVAAHEIGNVLKGGSAKKLIALFGRDKENVAFMINKLKTADKQVIWKALREAPDIRRVAEAGTKAERLAARRVNEVLASGKTAAFIDAWKTDKKAVIKIFKGMNTESKDNFLRALRNSPLAGPILLELRARSIWTGASLKKKIVLGATAIAVATEPISRLIFTATEIPQQGLMAIFARKAIEQEKGRYPPDISFKLNRSEKLIADIQWKIKDAMKRKQFDLAADYVEQLKVAHAAYRLFREQKKNIMHSEDYANTQALDDSTWIYIKDMLKQLRGEAPKSGQVTFKPKQKGAWVNYSGRRYNYKPFTPYNLGGGQKYSWTAGAPGYKTKGGSFWLDPWDKKDLEIDLEKGEEALGKVITKSTPAAEILLGGVDTGFITPHTFELPAGTYDFTFSQKGYKDRTKSATIWAGEEKTLDVILDEEWTDRDLAKGYVSIDTEPMGAHVFINGIVQNYPTPTKLDLDPGNYTITIKKSGYQDISDSVTVTAGETYIKSYEMQEEVGPDVWRVNVSSDPSGGKILVDGFFTGQWTPGYVDLLPGQYIIGVQKTGFVPIEEVVIVG